MSFVLKLLLGAQPLLTTWRFRSADANANITLSNANRTMSLSVASAFPLGARGTPYSVGTGKWYVEVKADAVTDTNGGLGIGDTGQSTGNTIGSGTPACGYCASGTVLKNGSSVATYAAYTSGDVIGFAVDGSNNKIWFSKNGVWQSGDPNTGTGGIAITAADYYPMTAVGNGGSWTIPLVPGFAVPGGFRIR